MTPSAHPEDVTMGSQDPPTTKKHFGTVHYETANGRPLESISCPTEADYNREIEKGCHWVEANPREYRGVWGERA